MNDRGLNARLRREFADRYHLRWSPRGQKWLLEQQVGRARPDVPPLPDTDEWTRAQLGRVLVMEVREHERFPCRQCGQDLRSPINKTAEVTCHCGTRHFTAFYPLDGDSLIQWVRRMDRNIGEHRHRTQTLTQADQARVAGLDKDHANEVDAISRDIFPQVAGIPQVGYTGAPYGNL